MALTMQEFEFWESGGEWPADVDFDWNELDARIKQEITPAVYDFLEMVDNDTARPVLSEYVEWIYFDKKPHFLHLHIVQALKEGRIPDPDKESIFENFN